MYTKEYMAKSKKHIEVKPRKIASWEQTLEILINSTDVRTSIYPEDGEVYVTIDRENYRAVVLKKDGTWSLD